MNFDVILAGVAGLVGGIIMGYAVRSYISYRRRRRTRGVITRYPLSPPSGKIEAPRLAADIGDAEEGILTGRRPTNKRR